MLWCPPKRWFWVTPNTPDLGAPPPIKKVKKYFFRVVFCKMSCQSFFFSVYINKKWLPLSVVPHHQIYLIKFVWSTVFFVWSNSSNLFDGASKLMDQICLKGQSRSQICLIKSVWSNEFDHKFDSVGPAVDYIVGHNIRPVTRNRYRFTHKHGRSNF